jgi:glycosyltransferase involved in cell wall biosynthesis
VAGDRLLARADRVILLSERARGLYRGFGLASDKTVVIPNFVEDAGFTPQTSPGTEWVYVGRLTQEKGVANLLRHWPETEILNIYGSGPLRHDVEAEAAARPNLIYHGHLDHDDIPTVLSGARGLVFPSEWAEGGCPLSYVEALAAGRVVVARAGNGAADDLEAAGCGEVFQSWSMLSEALSAARSRAQVAGGQGREHYESHYRRGVFLARTHALYDELISRHAKAHHA